MRTKSSRRDFLEYDREQLRTLYWEKNLNIKQIARSTGLPRRLVREVLSEFGPIRTVKNGRKYWRGLFLGKETERAYLLGFRAGDLNASKSSSHTIMVRVSTTHVSLLEMFEKTFFPYASCVITPRRVFLTGYDWQARAYLDDSFAFLTQKPIELPVEGELTYPFLAGLSDSEGCWCIFEDKDKAACSLSVTSASKTLLQQLMSFLRKECFHANLYRGDEKNTTKILRGTEGNKEVQLTRDTWRLELHRREEVRVLARRILPLSRHREKIRKICLILDERSEKWEIMGPKIEEERRRFEKETDESITAAEIEYKATHKQSRPAGSSASLVQIVQKDEDLLQASGA
jgi:hypothetical protein